MSRTYAIVKLLEHGELSVAQIHEIGGWRNYNWTSLLLRRMLNEGVVRQVKRGVYAV